jgi:hypothetical protein
MYLVRVHTDNFIAQLGVNIIVHSSGYCHHLLCWGCVERLNTHNTVHGNVAKAILMSCMNVALAVES